MADPAIIRARVTPTVRALFVQRGVFPELHAGRWSRVGREETALHVIEGSRAEEILAYADRLYDELPRDRSGGALRGAVGILIKSIRRGMYAAQQEEITMGQRFEAYASASPPRRTLPEGWSLIVNPRPPLHVVR